MITLSHIGLRYSGGPEILSDFSLTIEEESFHYLTGPSGSGKTSLMRLLNIEKIPSRGDIHFFGKDLSKTNRNNRALMRQKIGVIFQNFRLIPTLSVYDNIALPLRLHGIKDKDIKQEIHAIAKWIGLHDYLKVKPVFLSGGQQQRVAIARAIITKPKILLADEPTGSLDDEMGEKIMMLFEELNKKGTAIIVATHNKKLIKQFPHPQIKMKHQK